MSAPPVEPPPLTAQPASVMSWGWHKWFLILILTAITHLGLVILLGRAKAPAMRITANVPYFQLNTANEELVALTDPTLFALPHEDSDCGPSIWRLSPEVNSPFFSWSEPASALSPATNELGSLFGGFLRTNEFTCLKLDLKPPPRFAMPATPVEPLLPQNSTISIAGELAQRLLELPRLPSVAGNDVLKPGRVQVLVDENGNVITAVLLESCDDDVADRKSLEIARTLRFSPTLRVKLGEAIFKWHTVPTNAP